MKGLVFDIQRFSIHDGPGIRTTVFLKGCHARCFWCQNPEGLAGRVELQFFRDRCRECGECFLVCPHGAHVLVDGRHVILRDKCQCSGECVAACPAGALVFSGREMTASEVTNLVKQDQTYFDYSKGGVTLSGGEPLMQPDFSLEILRQCKDAGINTAIETTAWGREDAFRRILDVTDLVMMDVKHMDAHQHEQATGVDPAKSRNNAELLRESGKPLIIRVPVIPGFNNSDSAIHAIADYAAGFPALQYVELLPFHRLGEGKYESLDMACATINLPMPTRNEMKVLAEVAQQSGIPVKCAGVRSKPARNKAEVGEMA